MYEEVYQQILKTQLPPATERVAIALLNLAAKLAGQVTLSMDEFLTLCNIRNQRAALRHLTRLKQMGIIHYRTNAKTAQVSVTFRSWMALVGVEDEGQIEAEAEIEVQELEERDEDEVGPSVEGNLLEMAMALLNTTQLLLKSTMSATDASPIIEPGSIAPPHALPAPHTDPDAAPALVSKTTQTGQQVVVEVDAQNLVDHPDRIAPIRVPLGGATLVIQMDLEPTAENTPSNDDPQTDPTPKRPKTATDQRKSTDRSRPTYPHQKAPLLHRPVTGDLGESGENWRVVQDETEDEFLLHIKKINKEDRQKNKKDKENKEQRKKRAQDVPTDSLEMAPKMVTEIAPEMAPESAIPLDEQDRSFKLLTDPEVGITEKVARGMAQEHPFVLIRRQVFAWREDLRIGKMHNTGALVYRINNQFYAPELTMADRRSELYQRHRSPFEVEAEEKFEGRVEAQIEVQSEKKVEVEERIEARARVAFEEGVAVKAEAEDAVQVEEEVWGDLGVWTEVLAEMQQMLPTATFDIFLAKSRLVAIEQDDTYVIQVTDPYHQSYLEQRLQGILKRTLTHIVKKSRVQLRIESTQATPQKPAISAPVAFIQTDRNRSTFRGRLNGNVRKL